MSADAILDARVMQAPPLPEHRPPTKKEVWTRMSFIYHDLKDDSNLKRFCREWWAGMYLGYVNFRGWDKHPDWVDGEPVIPEAVPAKPFESGTNYIREVERLWGIAQTVKAVNSERRAA